MLFICSCIKFKEVEKKTGAKGLEEQGALICHQFSATRVTMVTPFTQQNQVLPDAQQ
jgi:hypothetical protein